MLGMTINCHVRLSSITICVDSTFSAGMTPGKYQETYSGVVSKSLQNIRLKSDGGRMAGI